MSKLVLILSLFGLMILLAFGVTDPNSPVVWLASTSVNFAILRVFLILVLLGLLCTHPPRNVYFRAFVGLVCLGLAGWALGSTYNNDMKILDTMALLQFSISAGLIVLERDVETGEKLLFERYEIATVGRKQLKAH